MTGYFEIINASAPHIYHSALVFTPQKSIVRKLYESHACPFTRVVRGLPVSWDRTTAATTRPSNIRVAARSPCDRFIAITWVQVGTTKIEVLDSVTLQQLQTIEHPWPESTTPEALAFSPDGRILTHVGSRGHELFVVSWDLQTGDVASAIRWQGPGIMDGTPSIVYFADGKTVGVCCRYSYGSDSTCVFDVASGVHTHSYQLTRADNHAKIVWTHGECLRFTTFGTKTINIWEVGFTPDAIPAKVETLPGPEGVDLENAKTVNARFLPAPCRLAFNHFDRVIVWDAQNSKYLLHCTDAWFENLMTFSSDGRFFACFADGLGVYLWKESATGYILHEILALKTSIYHLLLSRNGDSIVAFGGTTIRLWRTKGYATSPSSVSTRAQDTGAFNLLDFSPNGMFAAVARQRDETVIVLNLKSGVPQLTIDADMEVYGLGVIGNTVTVIGDVEFITWDLPTGDRVPGAKMTQEDSVRSAYPRGTNPFGHTSGASISLDSRNLAITHLDLVAKGILQLYDKSTGNELGQYTAGRGTPFFAPGGRDLWIVGDNGCGEVVRVGDGEQERLDIKGRVDIEDPPDGYPWASPRGYRVTDNRWILGPDEKRLLMLPPPWQSHTAVRRVWKGQFLALLHGELPEPVILELNQ